MTSLTVERGVLAQEKALREKESAERLRYASCSSAKLFCNSSIKLFCKSSQNDKMISFLTLLSSCRVQRERELVAREQVEKLAAKERKEDERRKKQGKRRL